MRRQQQCAVCNMQEAKWAMSAVRCCARPKIHWKEEPGIQLGSLLAMAMLTLTCSLLLALHLCLQYSSWDFLLLFLLIHLEGKTLCPHELKSPAAQAQSSITLNAQHRAHCMPTSSHPFQAFPFWLMKGAYKLPRNILKCEHEEVTEGFRRGHKPDR